MERMATLDELRAAWLWAKWTRETYLFNKHNEQQTVEILGFEEEVV